MTHEFKSAENVSGTEVCPLQQKVFAKNGRVTQGHCRSNMSTLKRSCPASLSGPLVSVDPYSCTFLSKSLSESLISRASSETSLMVSTSRANNVLSFNTNLNPDDSH